jgi:lipoprotein NlpD
MLAAAWLAAAACTSATSTRAPQRDSRAPVHVVQPGDTLSKIAWQYRLQERDLTVWNQLADPDMLRVGQRLRLVPPLGYVEPPPAPAAVRPAPVPPPAPSASTTRPRPPQPQAATPRPTPATTATAPAWSWPTDGPVVTAFGARGGIASGIAIGGREGQPVRAAAAGRVVYAGGGLMGYGQLVIIKHDETFLSAYGYNSNLLVTQGQDIARGTTIALMGQGPERQPRLHFEIRRAGVPVDPLLFVRAPR